MTSSTESTDDTTYLVVKNHEDQYSIWVADRPVPAGWESEGFSGTREECLARIDEIWVDMRPRSVREHLTG